MTLWLSTQAIAGSYKLDQLHEKNSELAEQVGKLDRTVTKRESASWLADHARELGMIPGGLAAKLVVDSDGSVTVVGDPHKVTAPDSDKKSADSKGSEESSDDDESDEAGSDDDGSDGDESAHDESADDGADSGDSDDHGSDED